MILVVADTGPIHYLILIDAVDLLADLYDKLVIPQTVAKELGHGRAPEQVRRWVESLPGWVEVHESPAYASARRLDLGELEAIALALELKPASLLLDEWEAKEEALRLGLPVSGTLGVLEKASKRGLVDLKQAIDRLLKTSFRIDSDLVRDVLSRNDGKRGE
ncbi:MAG TPA: DUF3368 domain-containing protein [Phycisphaerae bacterium]|nr:DUF3368 domain-containing protein [Phycisphaerae bacterium]